MSIEDKPKTLQQPAMHFGTFMGLFWIIKFTFLPLGFRIPLLQLFFILMTCFVPILGYIYVRKYRDKYCDGELSFMRGFTFTISMYFFAALLSAVGHYIYFQFIDQGFIMSTYMGQLEEIKSSITGELELSIDQLIESLETISSLSPLQLTMQLISQNIFYGTLMAIPTALLAMKRKKQF